MIRTSERHSAIGLRATVLFFNTTFWRRLWSKNRELKQSRFRDADGNRKWAIFTFTMNLPSHNHIDIAKYLFSIRDEWYKNLGDNTVLELEMFSCGCRPRLKNARVSALYYWTDARQHGIYLLTRESGRRQVWLVGGGEIWWGRIVLKWSTCIGVNIWQ